MQTRVWGAAAALALLAGSAAAQSRVEERRPAAPDGLVQIDNPAGSTRVVGWDRPEILVTGTLGAGAEGLTFEATKRRADIGVETEGNPHSAAADLEIKVPAGSRVEIESFNATIDVSGIKGSLKADTVQGRIVITASTGEVEADAVNGSIEISGAPKRVHAESVNGAVTISGASGEVQASTVNGRLAVSGGSFERVGLETVNGRVSFEGELRSGADLSAESVGGSVELRLPARTSAEFTVATFSGEVRNDFGPAAKPANRWTSEKELSFTVGNGSAKVNIETLSGDIEIRKQ
ncbi:MAG TPA: DUF4097 family beta strand repeat-containing protein [Vicinamibacteria bacterium]